jgi:hypothetical protein
MSRRRIQLFDLFNSAFYLWVVERVILKDTAGTGSILPGVDYLFAVESSLFP